MIMDMQLLLLQFSNILALYIVFYTTIRRYFITVNVIVSMNMIDLIRLGYANVHSVIRNGSIIL